MTEPTRPSLKLEPPIREGTLTPPRRVLRRAEGLLTSKGQPTVRELATPSLYPEQNNVHSSPSKKAALQLRRGIGSLKRMWSEGMSALKASAGSKEQRSRHKLRAHSVSGGAGGVGVNVHPSLDVVGDAGESGASRRQGGGRPSILVEEDPSDLPPLPARRMSFPSALSRELSASPSASSSIPPLSVESTESKSSASDSPRTPTTATLSIPLQILKTTDTSPEANIDDQNNIPIRFRLPTPTNSIVLPTDRQHSTPVTHPLRPIKEDHTHSFFTPFASPAISLVSPLATPGLPMSPSSLPSPTSPDGTFKHLSDIQVPQPLQEGIPLTKISARKRKRLMFRIDPDLGQIVWESKTKKCIPLENIVEIRTGQDVQHHLTQLHISSAYLPLWITIIYHLGNSYKILHLIAPTNDLFHLWVSTLRQLHEQRKELMRGLGNLELRQEMWAKLWWKGADEGADQKLSFEEVEKLCKKLNINKSQEDLERMFKQADSKTRGYLDFEDFRCFVKFLKHRTEMSRIYNKVIDTKTANTKFPESEPVFDFAVFERFMKQEQKSKLSHLQLRRIFEKFAREEFSHSICPARKVDDTETTTSSSSSSHSPPPSPSTSSEKPAPRPLHIAIPPPPHTRKVLKLEGFSAFLLSSDNSPIVDAEAVEAEVVEDGVASTSMNGNGSMHTGLNGDSVSASGSGTSSEHSGIHTFYSDVDKHDHAPASNGKPKISNFKPVHHTSHKRSSLKRDPTRTSSKKHSSITHNMTRPLSEYYISSSHNTYLVGHQLVGESTTEGYIRALLHGCRSVEVDIYDGENEPMIFHGKTLTTKVSLREVCRAIMKYGFVASPYPIIISAEVHCTVPQQDLIAKIMIEVFGSALVREETDGRGKIEALPSPEDLRGRILLKTKNHNLSRTDSIDSDISSIMGDSTTSSTSENEFFTPNIQMRMMRSKSDAAPPPRPSFLQRVRSVGRAPKPIKVLSAPTPTTPNTPISGPFLTGSSQLVRSPRATDALDETYQVKVKTSRALAALLVYTVGVKCRGLNKKEEYAPEQMFSLSENTANKMLKTGLMMLDLIKHCRTHLVRIYPRGSRVRSSNCEPHRYWAAGCQLVAMNWQTYDLGYMINRAMFQRNGQCGYVLKPAALRLPHQKELLMKRTSHVLDVTIISAQQLPRPKDASGNEIDSKSGLDPWVEVSLHVPDWPKSTVTSAAAGSAPNSLPPMGVAVATPARVISFRTSVVKNNGFNPVWEENLQIPFDCVGDLMDLIFVRFIVRQGEKDDAVPLAVYCASLGSLQQGFRHLPLHDAHLAQYLFSTLFVRIKVSNR